MNNLYPIYNGSENYDQGVIYYLRVLVTLA